MQSSLADQHIQARNFTDTNGRVIDLIVMHTDEANERPDNAENVAKFFANQAKVPPAEGGSSAHYCCDNNSIVSCVDEMDVAWGAPHVNHNGIHIEQSGDAAQRAAEWADEFSQQMLRTQVAPLVADIALRHGIPIMHLTNDQLRRGMRGIIGHVQASQVFGGSHTDPGSSYPWGLLISRAKAEALPDRVKFVCHNAEGKKLGESADVAPGGKAEEARLASFDSATRDIRLAELRRDGDYFTRRVKA